MPPPVLRVGVVRGGKAIRAPASVNDSTTPTSCLNIGIAGESTGIAVWARTASSGAPVLKEGLSADLCFRPDTPA